MHYVPDVRIETIEQPPSPSFVDRRRVLMIRWFGNMLRTNAPRARARPAPHRPLHLVVHPRPARSRCGPRLVGPVAGDCSAASSARARHPAGLLLLWVALISRYLHDAVLSHHASGGLGLVSVPALLQPDLRLDDESPGVLPPRSAEWTRQNTVGGLGLSGLRNLWKDASTIYLNAVAVAFFVRSWCRPWSAPSPPLLRCSSGTRPAINHDVKARPVHEAETQRQHVRVRIPLETKIDGRYFVVRDWSVGGVAFEDLDPPRRVGEQFTAKLFFPLRRDGIQPGARVRGSPRPSRFGRNRLRLHRPRALPNSRSSSISSGPISQARSFARVTSCRFCLVRTSPRERKHKTTESALRERLKAIKRWVTVAALCCDRGSASSSTSLPPSTSACMSSEFDGFVAAADLAMSGRPPTGLSTACPWSPSSRCEREARSARSRIPTGYSRRFRAPATASSSRPPLRSAVSSTATPRSRFLPPPERR